MFLNWLEVKDYYTYNCVSNKDFLDNLNKIPRNGYYIKNYKNIYGNIIKNNDMIESQNQYEELKNLYINNYLIAFRPGCIELSFLLKYYFDLDLKSHISFNNKEIDYHIKNNAGLYYKNINRKKEVLDWWCKNIIELFFNSTYCSCYLCLSYDLTIIAKLNLKGKYYNSSNLVRIILENSEGKKILYIGNSVLSVKTSFENNLKKLWKFPISNFSMYYLKTPQTTIGMNYPHETMIETCYEIIETIKNNYYDFDIAIFSCGCYGSCLMNILRSIYPNKNLIYLGSDIFRMFGLTHELCNWQNEETNINKEYLFEVLKELPKGCINHPEKKYWKISNIKKNITKNF